MSAKLIRRATDRPASAYAPLTLPSLEELALPEPEPPPAAHAPHSALACSTLPAVAVPETHAPQDHHPAGLAHLGEPAEMAHQIIEAARQEAEQVLAEARAVAAEIERESCERGLAEGQASAAAETSRAVEDLRQQLTQSLLEVARLRAEIAARAERDLVRLAIEIAKKIVHREVVVDHEIALTLARVALARLHNRAVARVCLHPEDYNYIQTHRERLGTDSSIEIVEDRAVGRGGCLVQTEMGDVDARIEQQFAEIERAFLRL
jgi:flagellar assembly protein FliH